MAKENGEASEESSVRVGGQLFDLEPLKDPPIGLWELLEKRGFMNAEGKLEIIGTFARGFEFLHCMLNATLGIEAIEALLTDLDPPVPMSVVKGIRTSEMSGIMNRVSAAIGSEVMDASPGNVGPSLGTSSKARTSSRGRTGGRSGMSEH